MALLQNGQTRPAAVNSKNLKPVTITPQMQQQHAAEQAADMASNASNGLKSSYTGGMFANNPANSAHQVALQQASTLGGTNPMLTPSAGTNPAMKTMPGALPSQPQGVNASPTMGALVGRQAAMLPSGNPLQPQFQQSVGQSFGQNLTHAAANDDVANLLAQWLARQQTISATQSPYTQFLAQLAALK